MFIGQGATLKVSKGILVVMKDTNIGNLYKLEGSTQFNEATMALEEKMNLLVYGINDWIV